jgi:hypothetical protein
MKNDLHPCLADPVQVFGSPGIARVGKGVVVISAIIPQLSKRLERTRDIVPSKS